MQEEYEVVLRKLVFCMTFYVYNYSDAFTLRAKKVINEY